MYVSDVPMYDIPCVRLLEVRVRAWVSISTRFNNQNLDESKS